MLKLSLTTAIFLVSVFALLVMSATNGLALPESPMSVDLTISKPPALGEAVTLTVTVVSLVNAPDTTLQIDLCEGFDLVEGSLVWKGNITKDIPYQHVIRIQAVKSGDWTLRARARQQIDERNWFGDTAYLYLHVEPGTGILGFESSSESALESARPPDGLGAKVLAPPSPGEITIYGYFYHYDRDNSFLPVPDAAVELYDEDLLNPDNLLGEGITDNDGYFEIGPVDNDDPQGGTQDVYLKFFATNSDVTVEYTNGNIFEWRTDTRDNVSDGWVDFYTQYVIDDSQNEPAIWVFVAMNKGRKYTPDDPGSSTAVWSPTSSDGTYYSRGEKIHLTDDAADSPDVVLHEYGHNVMWNVYGGWMPVTHCPSPHWITTDEHINCAWTEGWANFFPLAVLPGNKDMTYYGHYNIDLESPTWGSYDPVKHQDWAWGDDVEGRVAGALFDIFDSDNDGYDRFSDGFSNIWDVLYNNNSENFASFWTAWRNAGHNAGKMEAIAALFQNTIDYGFTPEIIQPTQTSPVYAGPYDQPRKIILEIAGSPGLMTADFSVHVGGTQATVITAYETPGKYTLENMPPIQVSNGLYPLEVTVRGQADVETDAILYADTLNIDVDLIIDRSGSMGSEGKMEAAKEAAKQFVDLMRTDDRIGVVSFDDVVETNFALTTITSPDIQTQAKNAIDSLYDRGRTSIGGGLQRGQEQLTTLGDASHPWAMVLLSDGLENEPPYVADVLPDIVASKTVVHTIGLGSDADEPLMQDIASQTGGTYHFAPGSQELAGIYNTIAGAVSGQQVLFSETGTVQQGETDEKDVVVDSTVSEATFSISWSDSGSTIDLTLRRPNGTTVDPSVAATDPKIDFISGSTYQYYRVQNPTAGVWTMRVTGGYIPLMAPSGTEAYTAIATGISGLTMYVYLDKDTYLTQQPVKISASLSDYQAITGATVTCEVQPPSSFSAGLHTIPWIEVNGDLVPEPGAVAQLKARTAVPASTIILYDDGAHGDGQLNDGVYANTFAGTGREGTYLFVVHASGNSNNSEAFTRQGEESIYIAPNPAPLRLIYLPLIVKAQAPSTSTWTPGAGITGRAVYGLTVAPDDCNTLYAATDAGLYKSTDNGASWSPTGLNTLLTASEPRPQAPPFAKAEPGAVNATLVAAVTTDPATGQTVYAATWGNGIYKSTDSGASWFPTNNGLGDLWLYAIVADPTNGQVLYAGGGSGGVYKSVDGGGSWTAVNSGLGNRNVRSLTVDPTNPQVVYVGTQGGVFKSVDGGGWWAATGGLGSGEAWSIVVDPANGQTVYVGLGGGGVYKSADGGGNWTAVNNGLGSLDLRALVIHPASSQTLYAGANGGGVYRTTNGGGSWSAMNDGLGNWLVKSLHQGANCDIIHAGTTNGAWRVKVP